ncbi:MAG: pantoate--beta-alanine ligase [Pseudomonadota bacterium]
MTIEIVRTVDEVRRFSRLASESGKTVALVPTMGGLHEGHLSLVEVARQTADVVIVSLFVNPTQFNNPEDLETYPGNEADDIQSLRDTGTNLLFAPTASEMYPKGFATHVSVSAAKEILCDAFRPGHFEGVATIVAKLFMQVEPDFACFGEKDYQQLFIIRTMVRDLNLPVEIVPCKTVREEDGLALSSRNARLSIANRKIAPQLNAAMREAADHIRNGKNPLDACTTAVNNLENNSTFNVEYLQYRSGETLSELQKYEKNGRLFAGAWLGDVRLIDNLPV